MKWKNVLGELCDLRKPIKLKRRSYKIAIRCPPPPPPSTHLAYNPFVCDYLDKGMFIEPRETQLIRFNQFR